MKVISKIPYLKAKYFMVRETNKQKKDRNLCVESKLNKKKNKQTQKMWLIWENHKGNSESTQSQAEGEAFGKT